MMSGKKSSLNQEAGSKRTASETDAPDVKVEDLCYDVKGIDTATRPQIKDSPSKTCESKCDKKSGLNTAVAQGLTPKSRLMLPSIHPSNDDNNQTMTSSASVPDLTSVTGRRARDIVLSDFKFTGGETKSTTEAGRPTKHSHSLIRYSKIYKKTSPDGSLVLFLPKRDLTIHESGSVDHLMGVALIHDNIINDKSLNVYVQVLLVFRYGRDDEELLGIRFCNEVVVASQQLNPPVAGKEDPDKVEVIEGMTDIDEGGVHVSGQPGGTKEYTAVPFVINLGSFSPPSVRLIPCRPYMGAPIGTGYEVMLFSGPSPDEIPLARRKIITMSLRVKEAEPTCESMPKADVYLERRAWFRTGGSNRALVVHASLDKPAYTEDDIIRVSLTVTKMREGGSSQSVAGTGIKRVTIQATQQVGIALFSTGTFKNDIGGVTIDPRDGQHPLDPKSPEFSTKVDIKIKLGESYSWAAMDDTSKKDAELVHLAPTVSHANKALFIVRVSYYVKIVIYLGVFTKPVNLRLPFVLKRSARAMHAFVKKAETTVEHPSQHPDSQLEDNGNTNAACEKTLTTVDSDGSKPACSEIKAVNGRTADNERLDTCPVVMF